MFSEIQQRLAEVQQARSDFQLAKFVIGQHGTAEMQYVQLLIELSNLESTIKTAKLSLREKEIELESVKNKNKELEFIAKERIQLAIDDLKIALIGANREFDYLKNLYNNVEHHFTRNEIEVAQLNYWKDRLTTNAKAMIQGNNAISPSGHI